MYRICIREVSKKVYRFLYRCMYLAFFDGGPLRDGVTLGSAWRGCGVWVSVLVEAPPRVKTLVDN